MVNPILKRFGIRSVSREGKGKEGQVTTVYWMDGKHSVVTEQGVYCQWSDGSYVPVDRRSQHARICRIARNQTESQRGR